MQSGVSVRFEVASTEEGTSIVTDKSVTGPGSIAGITLGSVSDLFGIDVSGDVAVTDDACLLYTSPSPRDRTRSRMPSSA